MAEPPFRNYHITDREAGQPLTAVLRQFLPGHSWSQVKRLVHARHVQINGNLCTDEARRLKSGEVLKVWQHPLAKPADVRDIRIHYIDQHLVVIEKPAGVTTLRHPEERNWPARRKQLQPTLDELLPRVIAKYLGWNVPAADAPPKSKQRSRTAPRRASEPKLPTVRAVHRLDRDTSGLMVFARTPQAEQTLIQTFRKHRIARSYVAVVHGHLNEQTIDNWLVRDRGDGLRGSSPQGEQAEGAQRAITHVRPIEMLDGYSIVRCDLKTGRTHQIRIHLSELGNRLCGEKTYTHALGQSPQTDPSGAPRQALHAAVLGFLHPITGEKLQFRSPLPRDLTQWLGRLKQGSGQNRSDRR
jgi:23S rRNA pseudouridine1911/1915/1917 synthase